MFPLTNRVAIITGASSGIGRAAARLFAEQGARLVLNARHKDKLEELADEIRAHGGETAIVTGDVSDEKLHDELVSEALARYGALHIAFNNAGTVGRMAPVPDLSTHDWLETVNTNLNAAFYAARRQIPAMLESGGGSIVFTSSFVGNTTAGMPGMAAYAAAKAGIVGLVKALAVEHGRQGIRVNALLPGGTDTAMATFETDEQRAFVENMHGLKRIARPEEIAQAALFLASEAASFVTGTAMLADGGVSITKV